MAWWSHVSKIVGHGLWHVFIVRFCRACLWSGGCEKSRFMTETPPNLTDRIDVPCSTLFLVQFCGPPLTAAKWSLTLTLTDGRCAVNASRFCQHAYRSGMETEGIQLLIIYFTLACSWGSCPRWPWLITASILKYICFLLNFVRTLIQWWSPSRSGNFKCVFCILARFFACAYVVKFIRDLRSLWYD